VPLPGYTLDLEVVTVVSSAGGRKGYVAKSRHKVYRALRRKGMSKSKAARISNAGTTHAERSRMARRAARTRRSKR
jgi:hypothetical protein